MAAQVEVEDVEARAREVVGEAARRQVPRVAVLPEAVDEQDGRARALPPSAARLRTIASGTRLPVTTISLWNARVSSRSTSCSTIRPWRITREARTEALPPSADL